MGCSAGIPTSPVSICAARSVSSKSFVASTRHPHSRTRSRAVSTAAAGIGRVTAGVLSKVCDVVDVVEPVEKFAKEVHDAKLAGKGTVGEVFVTGLQVWEAREKYDLVWNQWCLGHLTDEELCCYLRRCGNIVQEGGWIVIKENLSTDPMANDMFDEVDSSVIRTDAKFRRLFEESGLKIVRTEIQRAPIQEIVKKEGIPKGNNRITSM
ncbi:MAG: hypothetical protein Q9210_004717 [Variospora velana]